MRRVVILGRGGAGKPALSRQLSDVTGIPAVELDALFWQRGPTPLDPSRWAARQAGNSGAGLRGRGAAKNLP